MNTGRLLYHIAVHCHCSFALFSFFRLFWGFWRNTCIFGLRNETSYQRRSSFSQRPGGNDWGGRHRAFFFFFLATPRIYENACPPHERTMGPRFLFYTQACLGLFTDVGPRYISSRDDLFSKRLFLCDELLRHTKCCVLGATFEAAGLGVALDLGGVFWYSAFGRGYIMGFLGGCRVGDG